MKRSFNLSVSFFTGLLICSLSTSAQTMSPFGIGSDHQHSTDLTTWLPQMADIGIPNLRTCLPKQMDYVADHHMQFGGLLYGLPPGDTLDARGSLPVKDLSTWSAYVTDRVKAANGQVKYWEVWNEPPNGIGPGQTAADYARLMISTFNAAHAIDPNCKVGLAAKSVDINWLEQTIKAGAKDHFDYIVLHPYETLGVAVNHAGSEGIFMDIVPNVRKMLTAQNAAKANVPIIFTELGCDTSKGVDHQAHALVKAYTMGIAQGVSCIEWFEGMDGDSGPMGLMDAKGKPRPAYTAMAQMIKHLGLHPHYLGWVLLNHKNDGFVFQGARGNVLITWAPVGTTDHVDLGKSVEIIDPLTGLSTAASSIELATTPVIVLNVPDAIAQQAAANQPKPFPWDGDFTSAKSISVTYGHTNTEKGLHTQSAQSVARDVLAYGGSSRSGNVPGGSVFMVDPHFLSYDPTPIEISIVVRRDEANDNAGFKLVYESTSGFKNLGWYTVPDNKEWHTLTYQIRDSEFVGMYGFNFSLDSDGNKYNKYDIQSVTVTKLDH
jgi:hypothetical protein